MSVDKQGTISLSFLISEYSFFKFSISQDLAKYGIPPARYQLTIVLNLSFYPWSARLFLDFDIYWALQSFSWFSLYLAILVQKKYFVNTFEWGEGSWVLKQNGL